MAWRIPCGARTGRRLAFVARVGGWQEPEREEDKQKSRPARVITTLKYRYNGEGFTYDRRRHVFVVAADGGARAPAHRRRLGRRRPRVVARRAAHRLRSARHAGPRSRRQQRPLAGGRRRAARRGGSPTRWAPRCSPPSPPTGAPSRISAGARSNEYGRNIRVFTVATDGGDARGVSRAGLDRSCAPLGDAPDLVARRARRSPSRPRIRARSASIGCAATDGAAPVARSIDGERVVTGFSLSARRRPHRLHGHRSRHAGRGVRRGARRRRRAPAHRPEPRLAGRGGARPPGALPLRARGLLRRRLGDEAARRSARTPRGRPCSTSTAARTPSTATASSTSSRSTPAPATG